MGSHFQFQDSKIRKSPDVKKLLAAIFTSSLLGYFHPNPTGLQKQITLNFNCESSVTRHIDPSRRRPKPINEGVTSHAEDRSFMFWDDPAANRLRRRPPGEEPPEALNCGTATVATPLLLGLDPCVGCVCHVTTSLLFVLLLLPFLPHPGTRPC